jgi:hypothetical protein
MEKEDEGEAGRDETGDAGREVEVVVAVEGMVLAAVGDAPAEVNEYGPALWTACVTTLRRRQ